MLSETAQAAFDPAIYQAAQPFPHLVLDQLLEPVVAAHVAAELKQFSMDRSQWWRFPAIDAHADQVRKRGLSDFEKMTPLMRMASDYFNSAGFLHKLEQLTGISGLLPDPAYEGGGYHQTGRGGKLGVHHDFNVHAIQGERVYRRINLLLYMNREWSADWAGQLELWEKDLSSCAAIIEPRFNRAVIFTIDDAPHGHPQPLNCPENETRRSLAYYYYTREEPQTERRYQRAHWKYGDRLI
ncbi:MAG: 2OG-Fe(II) oxygenase [Thiolinea sp.]